MTDSAETKPDVVLVGRYRLQELLGEGAMGSVWRALDTTLGRTVAVKQVRLAGLSSEQAEAVCQRTMREARIAASLRHRNVVTVHDVVTVRNEATGRDEPWLILEYLPSRTLADVLQDGPLVPQAAATIGEQIAAALTAAHASGVIHRDVKPGNVLLTPGRPPEVKLTDFGISHAPGAADITATGVLSGTPAYMAPETARTGDTDARSDVYSLGATLYEAVEGHPPFGRTHGHVHELLYRIATQPVPPPSGSGPFADLLRRMLAADPGDRPTSAEVESALHRIAADPAGTTTSNGPPLPFSRRRPEWRLTSVLTAIALIFAGATAAVVLSRDVEEPLVPTSRDSGLPQLAPVAIADPRTADPCSLLDVAVLAPFGPAQVDPFHGPFASCRVDVGRNFAVDLELLAPADRSPPGGMQLGAVLLSRSSRHPTHLICSRVLTLTDRNLVWITASDLYGTRTLDVCAMAEAAARGAVGRLAGPGIATRPPLDTTSQLARVDACTLLTAGDLAVLPDLGAPDPDPELGGWRCAWGDTTRTAASSVEITYQHRGPFNSTSDGVPVAVGGRQAYREVVFDRCVVTIPQRSFLIEGRQLQETVHVAVAGPAQDRCLLTLPLAEAVVSRLPLPA